jgi:hypothetical protein
VKILGWNSFEFPKIGSAKSTESGRGGEKTTTTTTTITTMTTTTNTEAAKTKRVGTLCFNIMYVYIVYQK